MRVTANWPGYNLGMDLHAELARFNPSPELADWVLGRLQQVVDEASVEVTRRDQELTAAQTKIQALTLELAHLRRMRFGAKSEALSTEQRDLFQETLASDVAAAEAELAQQAQNAPTPVHRVPVPVVSPCPSTCHASNATTNPSPAPAVSAAMIWSRSVKTSANNSTSNRPGSSSTVTSARSTPAGRARRSPPPPSRPL